MILGILVSFVHDGVKYETNSLRYKKYVISLRKHEEQRIKRKFFYDLISKYCSIMPNSIYIIIKKFAAKIFLQQITF